MNGNDPDGEFALPPTLATFVSAFKSVAKDMGVPCRCLARKNHRHFLNADVTAVVDKQNDIRAGIKNAWAKMNMGIAFIYIYIYVCMYVRTYVRTYIHTYIHTYIYI